MTTRNEAPNPATPQSTATPGTPTRRVYDRFAGLWVALSEPATTTLTGFLGSDREIRWTRPRTYLDRVRNPVAQMWDIRGELTTHPKAYARLSLATHDRIDGRWETRWVPLVVWNVERMEHFNVLLARKGDRVTVTGYYQSFHYTAEDGTEREVTRFIVESFERTRPKITPRREWD